MLEKVRVFNRCYKTLALAFDSNMTRVLPLSNGTNESPNKEFTLAITVLAQHCSRSIHLDKTAGGSWRLLFQGVETARMIKDQGHVKFTTSFAPVL